MEQLVGTSIGIVLGLMILAVFGGIVGWLASLLIKGPGWVFSKISCSVLPARLLAAGYSRAWA